MWFDKLTTNGLNPQVNHDRLNPFALILSKGIAIA
jgi:hypothetical protein